MFSVIKSVYSRYEGSVNPIPGTFSYRTDKEKEAQEFSAVTLSCETKFPSRVPYGVSILGTNSQGILFLFKYL